MADIRTGRPEDLEALYRIAHLTGDNGGDASALYADPRLVGHIYSAPYLVRQPDLVFVAEMDGEVLGYCVGTLDTKAFEAWLEQNWWPDLRPHYARPDEARSEDWTAQECLCNLIHQSSQVPAPVSDLYPAHVHMNLLPGLRGQGAGGRLLDAWLKVAVRMGAKAVHIGASPDNPGAVHFWGKQGFEPLDGKIDLPGDRTVWMGRTLQDASA